MIKATADFIGFNKEAIELTIEDGGNKHDHLEMSINGKRLGYFHLDANSISLHTYKDNKAHVINIKEYTKEGN